MYFKIVSKKVYHPAQDWLIKSWADKFPWPEAFRNYGDPIPFPNFQIHFLEIVRDEKFRQIISEISKSTRSSLKQPVGYLFSTIMPVFLSTKWEEFWFSEEPFDWNQCILFLDSNGKIALHNNFSKEVERYRNSGLYEQLIRNGKHPFPITKLERAAFIKEWEGVNIENLEIIPEHFFENHVQYILFINWLNDFRFDFSQGEAILANIRRGRPIIRNR